MTGKVGIGSVLIFPMIKDLYGACRILQCNSRCGCLVLCSKWIGHGNPMLDDQGLMIPVKVESGDTSQNKPLIVWIPETPPPDFKLVGIINPSVHETVMDCGSYLPDWQTLREERLLQWRWEYDRERLLEEEQEFEKTRLSNKETINGNDWKNISLNTLAQKIPCNNWEGVVNAHQRKQVEDVLTSTLQYMNKVLTNNGDYDEKLCVIKDCIRKLNELQSETDIIETMEREDICEWLICLQKCVGLPNVDLTLEWRDW